MLMRLFLPISKYRCGMTIIELMVVVAIIGILGIIAVPTFVSYRNKSRVASAMSTSETIRTALAGYAVNSAGNLYPLTAAVSNWDDLRFIINDNGGSLRGTLEEMGLESLVYTSDSGQTYDILITVSVPEGMRGHRLEVGPGGVVIP